MGWVGLIGLGWIGMDWVGLGSDGWVGLDWVGLGSDELGWIGLGWVGLDWVGLSWKSGNRVRSRIPLQAGCSEWPGGPLGPIYPLRACGRPRRVRQVRCFSSKIVFLL